MKRNPQLTALVSRLYLIFQINSYNNNSNHSHSHYRTLCLCIAISTSKPLGGITKVQSSPVTLVKLLARPCSLAPSPHPSLLLPPARAESKESKTCSSSNLLPLQLLLQRQRLFPVSDCPSRWSVQASACTKGLWSYILWSHSCINSCFYQFSNN